MTSIQHVLVFVALAVFVGSAVATKTLPELKEDLFQMFRRQHAIGLPCTSDTYCRVVASGVCCNGYCHYTCNDTPVRPPLPTKPINPDPNDEAKITLEECQVFVDWRVCSWDCEVADLLCAQCKKLYNKELNWQ